MFFSEMVIPVIGQKPGDPISHRISPVPMTMGVLSFHQLWKGWRKSHLLIKEMTLNLIGIYGYTKPAFPF